jgi:uncharacterized membrane protein YkvA (DUF1232 family)
MVYDASIDGERRPPVRYIMNIRKVLIGILTLLYIISPYDIIPDFIIPVGWLDDLGVLGLLIYYFKKGKLPRIFFRRKESSEKKDA